MRVPIIFSHVAVLITPGVFTVKQVSIVPVDNYFKKTLTLKNAVS